jgi:N4-gp56 family major capsid protein
MATTVIANLIDPEVLAAKVNAKLTDNMVFLPVADVDDTLVGKPGDTLTFPVYAYIGDAADVAENGQIVPVALSETSVEAKVKKAGKGVQITDEAVLSGHGDPVGEAGSQLALAIDNHTDNDLLTALEGISATHQFGTEAAISPDVIADSLTLFGEDEEGAKALYISVGDKATLRKSDDFIKATDLGDARMSTGVMGELWGCQIIPANKIKADSTNGEIRRFIVKPGALKVIRKRDTMMEPKREADYGRTSFFVNKHYTAYLYDESKVVMIRQFTALKDLAAEDVVSTAGTAATNGTFLDIKKVAPVGMKWVYKLGSADVTNAAFGTALTGYTDWTSKTTEIAASTSTKAHVALVDADNKPVKQLNVTLVKKA